MKECFHSIPFHSNRRSNQNLRPENHLRPTKTKMKHEPVELKKLVGWQFMKDTKNGQSILVLDTKQP
jgi:hypothetical protein